METKKEPDAPEDAKMELTKEFELAVCLATNNPVRVVECCTPDNDMPRKMKKFGVSLIAQYGESDDERQAYGFAVGPADERKYNNL